MKALFSKTGLGLLAALLLVLLFYGRMLGEAQDTLAKANRKKAQDAAKEQAAKDTETQRHRELVSALHAVGGPASTGATPANSTLTKTDLTPTDTTKDAIKAEQIRRGLPADGIEGPALRAARARETADSTATLATKSATPAPADARQWGLAALLLGLGAAAYLGYLGWRESRAELVDADPNDRDTQLLELLMGAFAGSIGRALPIPRQVKRFASKARLQHNLLAQLADETRQAQLASKPRLTPPFDFGATQQVLAFLLLLLLEDRTTDPGARQPPLRELAEDDFVVSLRERFGAWHRAGTDYPAYTNFAQQAGSLAAPPYAELPAELDAADRLLIQLHRLNAGLLV